MASNPDRNDESGIVLYFNTCVDGLDLLYEAAAAGSEMRRDQLKRMAVEIVDLAASPDAIPDSQELHDAQ